MSTPHPQPRPSAHRAAALALLLVFVLTQTLGWMHRGLHGASGVAQHAVPAQLAAPSQIEPSGWLDDLFGSHTDASDCRLFDVMAKPGCVPQMDWVPPPTPTAAFLLASHADLVIRWAALFDARGPPLPR